MADEKKQDAQINEKKEEIKEEKNEKTVELLKMKSTQKKLTKKSTVNVLTEDSGYRVDFFIYVYKKKGRDDQQETFLQQIEGHVEPGTVCAVIGPRNSGKQRLLQLLSGRATKHICLGSVRVNGTSYNAPYMRATTSFLSDAGTTLISHMTIAEAVSFVAYLVLPGDINDEAREKRIGDVLKEVGLDKKADTLIETVTAEDRVRIDLAQVLMEGKKIIFLDEPTKSLDLIGAEKIINTIIKITESRLLTVFVSLEHPTKLLLEKFHKCLFLANGRQVYFGPVRHTVDFFSRLGFAIPEETSIYDHVLALCVPQDSGKSETQEKYLENLLIKANAVFEELQMAKLNPAQKKDRQQLLEEMRTNNTYIRAEDSFQSYPISWGKQFKILFMRYLTASFRDREAFFLRVFLTGIWFLVFWLLCFKSGYRRGSMDDLEDLVSAWTLGLAGIQSLSILALPEAESSASTFHSDQQQNLYRPSAFVVAQLLIGFIVQFVLMILISVAYFIILGFDLPHFDESLPGHTTRERVSLYFQFSGLLLLVAVISEIIGLSIALVSTNHNAMYLITMFVHFVWVMLSGGVIRLCTNLWDGIAGISWISPSKHALDGLLLSTVNGLCTLIIQIIKLVTKARSIMYKETQF